MSTLKVEVVKITEILSHPNADRLELAKILGWITVVPKGEYRTGDLVVYIPIDSILPAELENKIFGPESKIRLEKSRVRTIKIRGAVSQGMVVSLNTLSLFDAKEGDDVTDLLGIKKFEPQESKIGRPGQAKKRDRNPNFHKYTDIENIKNHPNVFVDGEHVYITEKIHGTNFRCGWVPTEVNTWWKWVKSKLRMLAPYEFVYGSHNVQLSNKLLGDKTFYGGLYAQAVKTFKLKDIIPKGWVIYGEIYGDGIQKNYTYGCEKGEFGFAMFDLMIEGTYQNYRTFSFYADMLEQRYYAKMLEEGIKPSNAPKMGKVPLLYAGPFNLERAKELTFGASILAPVQPVREGVVIKPEDESVCHCGRKVLKFISDDYLLDKTNTDNH